MNNLLITGPSRIGKTTILERLATILAESDYLVNGFISPAELQNGERIAFTLRTISGRTFTLSQKSGPDFGQQPLKIGNHFVDLTIVDRVMVPMMEEAANNSDIFLLDEIGPMEIMSLQFRSALSLLLDMPTLVVASISIAPDRYISRIMSREDVFIVEVDQTNRDLLPQELAEQVIGMMKQRSAI